MRSLICLGKNSACREQLNPPADSLKCVLGSWPTGVTVVRMSTQSLVSCLFYSWTTGGASFVKTAAGAAGAGVLMVPAHLWIM